jgi:hypothetical protein
LADVFLERLERLWFELDFGSSAWHIARHSIKAAGELELERRGRPAFQLAIRTRRALPLLRTLEEEDARRSGTSSWNG